MILHVQDLYKDNQEANKKVNTKYYKIKIFFLKALEFFELVETNSLQVISDQKNLPAHFFEVEIKVKLKIKIIIKFIIKKRIL